MDKAAAVSQIASSKDRGAYGTKLTINLIKGGLIGSVNIDSGSLPVGTI